MRKLVLILLLFSSINGYADEPLNREMCRKSDSTEFVANCIEQRVYDPCDDAGGSWGDSQCAWAHSLVAERRILRALENIQRASYRAKFRNPNEIYSLKWSQKNWELYRDQYCMFRNEAFTSSEVFNGEKLGYCHRRLNEKRAEDLERMLVK